MLAKECAAALLLQSANIATAPRALSRGWPPNFASELIGPERTFGALSARKIKRLAWRESERWHRFDDTHLRPARERVVGLCWCGQKQSDLAWKRERESGREREREEEGGANPAVAAAYWATTARSIIIMSTFNRGRRARLIPPPPLHTRAPQPGPPAASGDSGRTAGRRTDGRTRGRAGDG